MLWLNMEIHLPPEQEAHLAKLATDAGRSPSEIVQEAIALWEERRAEQLRQVSKPRHTPAQAAARIRELRKGSFLPEGETIEDLIKYGRA